jgi:hypothetical protein
MERYHSLSFHLAELGSGAKAVTACIDGVALTELVAAFEQQNGYTDPAGGYGGLVPDYMNYGRLDDYFLGRDTSPCRQANGAQYLLGCECGEVGCWPFMCRIVAQPGAYEWRDFHNPCREARDYRGLGPFRFEAASYELAVGELMRDIA